MKKQLLITIFLSIFYGYAFPQCGPNQIKLKVSITTDPYGNETSWTLKNLVGSTLMQGGQGGVYGPNTTYSDSICVDTSGCYFFDIYDTYGDGIFNPGGYSVFVDGNLVDSGSTNFTSQLSATVYCPDSCNLTFNALNDFNGHINGINLLSKSSLNLIRNTFIQFPECLAQNQTTIQLAKNTVSDYDAQIGVIFTTPNTLGGFSKDSNVAPNMETEKAMIALQQGILDAVMTPAIFNQYPQSIYGWKFNSCVNFPGNVNPPLDSTISKTVLIRANFEDPEGMNPFFDINFERMKHALRPTGIYLAPGSVVSVTVPDSLVGQDYYIRVGSHDWDLSERPTFKRLDRISKKFRIDSNTTKIYNPLGGAISILVPYGANDGNLQISIKNGVEAPFFSLKSFYETPNFNAELNKPGPWAVFESENVMYTIPKHSIIPNQFDLRQTLEDWETAFRGVNSILARQIIPDKHNMYMITDLDIRTGVYSIGYPMSNSPLDYINVPGPAYFINGPGTDDEVGFHETGHALNIAKFPGEEEALVNFPYIMAMNYGLKQDLNQSVRFSFVPNTFDINKTAIHRMVSNSFGGQRDISNTTTDEVRYQHRGYGHYFEIVNILGWCPIRNFYRQEFLDFNNGINPEIYRSNDGRIIRMCIAAQADLRPLLSVFGIVAQDSVAVQDTLNLKGILPSLAVYLRLQDYLSLIPQDSTGFTNYALSVYPNLFTDGPNEDPNFGVGWHYLKAISYNNAEAQQRLNILQSIINYYYPLGAPNGNTPVDVCCTLDTLKVSMINQNIVVSGGVSPYNITTTTNGNINTVTVIDYDSCSTTYQYFVTGLNNLESNGINIYPNPASSELIIDLGQNGQSLIGSKLISISGQTIKQFGKDETILDISAIGEGIFILRIELENGTEVNKKIVIRK